MSARCHGECLPNRNWPEVLRPRVRTKTCPLFQFTHIPLQLARPSCRGNDRRKSLSSRNWPEVVCPRVRTETCPLFQFAHIPLQLARPRVEENVCALPRRVTLQPQLALCFLAYGGGQHLSAFSIAHIPLQLARPSCRGKWLRMDPQRVTLQPQLA